MFVATSCLSRLRFTQLHLKSNESLSVLARVLIWCLVVQPFLLQRLPVRARKWSRYSLAGEQLLCSARHRYTFGVPLFMIGISSLLQASISNSPSLFAVMCNFSSRAFAAIFSCCRHPVFLRLRSYQSKRVPPALHEDASMPP